MNIIISPKISSQQGVGLIEVLVSLLLLAVAILGFSAMQLRAVQATDESMSRNRALTEMRAGAEMMRANPPEYKSQFKTTLNELYPKFVGDEIEKQHEKMQAKCSNAMCTPQELAKKDATALVYFAQQQDIKVNMIDCPAAGAKFNVIDGAGKATPINNTRHCFIASWGNTKPIATDDVNDKTACLYLDKEKKISRYVLGATCFVMESY